jgi:hypothetical protein
LRAREHNRRVSAVQECLMMFDFSPCKSVCPPWGRKSESIYNPGQCQFFRRSSPGPAGDRAVDKKYSIIRARSERFAWVILPISFKTNVCYYRGILGGE